MSSTETAEKLLTKLSGFLISWAMPAVSWPSEASFSVCTRRSCAVRKSSSDFANSRVRASTLSNSRTFSIAITAWSAKVVTSSICLSVNGRTSCARQGQNADRRSLAQQRHAEDSTKIAQLCASTKVYSGSVSTSGICTTLPSSRRPSCCCPTLRNDWQSPERTPMNSSDEAVSCYTVEYTPSRSRAIVP